MVFRLLYQSNAIHPVGHKSDLEILEEALAFNPAVGITGLLLRTQHHFFQVLEGDRTAVGDLLKRIRKDPRHRNLTVLNEWETPERMFEGWAMAYRQVPHLTSPLLKEPAHDDADHSSRLLHAMHRLAHDDLSVFQIR